MKKPCVVLGVTGGIAAYKAADIARRLHKNGCDVFCIMTKNALNFITRQTMETMSANPVVTDMFEAPRTWEVEHIALANRADVFLIAPATANFIGKYANGIADDMLSTTIMATRAKVLIVPAMNTNMYESPANQRNMQLLRGQGVHFLEPIEGMLANGHIGKGHIPEVDDIVAETLSLLKQTKDMQGRRVLVTAGPTREAIDPVRYITNHSSGKMGYEIAAAAQKRGAEVTLVSGPVALECPYGVQRIMIDSTNDLFEKMIKLAPGADIVIQAAAPADYRPKDVAAQKIKKSADEGLSIELVQNEDVAAAIGKNKKETQVFVAFAAETNDVFKNAQGKLSKKNTDFIVANDVSREGAGFNVDTNIAALIDRHEIAELPLMQKSELAEKILDKALSMWEEKNGKED